MMKKFEWMICHLLAVGLLFSAAATALGAEVEEGFTSIFNGKNLTGWDGDPRLWSVADGMIRGQTTKENPAKHNTFLIWRGGTLDDFELRLSFRITSGNSGVQIRSKDRGNWRVTVTRWRSSQHELQWDCSTTKVGGGISLGPDRRS